MISKNCQLMDNDAPFNYDWCQMFCSAKKKSFKNTFFGLLSLDHEINECRFEL